MKKTRDNEQIPLAAGDEAEILARLSERVEKAVATIQELRRERDELRAQLETTEGKLQASETKLEVSETKLRDMTTLEDEADRFRRERSEIRDRIESMLTSLEALEET